MRRAAVCAAVILAACTQPPTRELQSADAAVKRARQEGAAEYAPERLQEAEKALADAQAQVQAREYLRAVSQANAASERAQAARSAATARRLQLKVEIDSALNVVRGDLQAANAARADAVAQKVAETTFADADAASAELQRRVQELEALVAAGKLNDAATRTAALKSDASALRTTVGVAIEGARAAKAKAKPKPRPTRRKR